VKILGRQRCWAFLKAYATCFTALVGLYVVIDAFSNFDEFTTRASGTGEIFMVMGRHYLAHMSEFCSRLCGVAGVMAAIFTVCSGSSFRPLSGTERVWRRPGIGTAAGGGRSRGGLP
jgi:hypothetical protein